MVEQEGTPEKGIIAPFEVSASAVASASAAAAASMKTVVVRFADADAAADYCSFRRRRKLRSMPTLPQEA
ncbi:hypothetical protein F2Q69_00024515 [Brassica cretica]|uniref:Uncharacterized protein n=1 Tax=Brassica cretica TaxID=69181 RepID=A0A8S9Q528_BRACR|nr:hypothetical protein F2Q69_00024515 [Brassica cretica]